MNAAEIKREIKELGFWVCLEVDPTVGGKGHEYAVYRKGSDDMVCHGWTLGNKTDGYQSALESLTRYLMTPEQLEAEYYVTLCRLCKHLHNCKEGHMSCAVKFGGRCWREAHKTMRNL